MTKTTEGMPQETGHQKPAPPSPLNLQQTAWDIHPLRTALYDELHAFPFPVVQAPVRITHMAFLHNDGAQTWEIEHLHELCRRYSVDEPPPEVRSFHQDFGEFRLRWEFHNEFSTYTIFAPGVDSVPFKQNALELLPTDWLERLDGTVVVAVHLAMLKRPSPEPDRETLKACFEGHLLSGSQVTGQRALVWTAFRLHGDGFGRYLIYDQGLTGNQGGRLIHRLLGMENYRLMALLGLPLARRIGPRALRMGDELAGVIGQIPHIKDLEDERRLLRHLLLLAANVEQFRSETGFRFAATAAYYNHVTRHLQDLRENWLRGVESMGKYMNRRLEPAVRSCTVVQERLDELSRRITRADDLLRTRVNLTLEEQNQQQLTSMNEMGHKRLRLQKTVEGFSVAAISYYLIGLIKTFLDGLKATGLDFDIKIAMGLVILPVVLGVWWMIKRIHGYIEGDEGH